MQKNKKNKNGFMMLELILSIFILSMILVSFSQVISKTYAEKNNKIDIVIATGLAQEGIELVRNKRDVNWSISPSKTAFDGISNNEKVNYNDNYSSNIPTGCSDVNGCPLYIDANGFYVTNDTGTPSTKFSRKTTVSPSGGDKLVTSTVYWTDVMGNSRNIEISNNLSDWGDK